MYLRRAHLDTLAVRAGIVRTSEGEHAEPIFLTSSYVFDSAADAAARFCGRAPGNVYSRYTNPTVRTFEQRIAALEGGEQAVGNGFRHGGDSQHLHGVAQERRSRCLLAQRVWYHDQPVRQVPGEIRRGGDVCAVAGSGRVASAIRPNTAMLFVETPSNPLCEVADLARYGGTGQGNDCLLVVDNCFCTPALQTPLALGADIVVHSATKYLDGQGRCVGGAVVGSQEHMEELVTFLRTCGPTMSAFNAWVFLKGLETLRLRMEAHSRSALELAAGCGSRRRLSRFFMPAWKIIPGTSWPDAAARIWRCAVFQVKGGRQQAWQ